MEAYTEAIKSFYANSKANLERGTEKDIDEFKKGMDNIVKGFSHRDGFHHVITEMAFLEIRAEQEVPKGQSIIPVILNGNTPLFDFDELLIYVPAGKVSNRWIIHESQILHELFFGVLGRLFNDLTSDINEFKDCYDRCVGMLSSNLELDSLSKQKFEPSLSTEIANAINRVARASLATVRTG
jgi:hypothetical protein